MPAVEFVQLRKPEKAKHLCELAEAFFDQGYRVLITVVDENQGVTLDRFMWTWKKGSFIPHAYDNGAVDCLDEPVVIGQCERNPNGAQVLIMGKPCGMDFVRQFEHVIDFAEVYDDHLREASRERFRLFREAGFAPRMR
ncbi:DNA polymerase III subunit chi [Desulfuromonas sp. AOP6]|uniref:DNA polymerase III subunit chi n=1 Tax=Desulfuromonas sp. AOP6 TaxID=1566351 RepID=UPI00126B8C3A|nr:DNA polymerase III subunit chi [Desulfuromonas sp. AOP6]BCA79469.1 DNA polymerase III subunit chi [Desulfuromonas sp. AOP6]